MILLPNRLTGFYLLLVPFLFFVLLLIYPSSVSSQECYVNIPSDQTLQSYCAQPGEANWNPNCSLQGNTCPGTTQPGGGGTQCWACVANPTQTPESCDIRSREDPILTCSGLGYTITNDGNGGCPNFPKVQCTGQRSDGCYYCVAPLCPSDTACYDGVNPNTVNCLPCSNITCSVNSVNVTGPTSANATSKVDTGQYDGYDGVNWYLNSNKVGTTAMGADGTAANSFVNLVSGTQYTIAAEYFDNQQGRPAVMCSPMTFQFNPAQMTCSLSVSPQSTTQGGSASWSIQNSPSGATAQWGGTNPDGTTFSGPVSGYSNATEWFGTYIYNTQGSYTRYVQIKDSGGNIKCTTDTQSLFVYPPNSNNCNLGVTPTSLTISMGTNGENASAKKNVSWSAKETSVAKVSPLSGKTTTVSPVSVGTATITAEENSTCHEFIQASVVSSTPACPGGIAGCGDSNAGGLGSCSTAWTYQGNTGWNAWCSQQTSGARAFCYTCSPVASPPPASSPPPTNNIPFNPGGFYIKGPLLWGKLWQDINSSFKIDSPDLLASKSASLVSGQVRVLRNGLAQVIDILGRIPNVLRGSPFFHEWTTNGTSGDDKYRHDEFAYVPKDANGNPLAFTSPAASTNFLALAGSTKCQDWVDKCSSYGGKWVDDATCTVDNTSCGGFKNTTVSASSPFFGVTATDAFDREWTTGTPATTTTLRSFKLANVGSGNCVSGCTLQTKAAPKLTKTDQHQGFYPANSPEAKLNPDGTCFVERYEDCADCGVSARLVPDSCTGGTCTLQAYKLTSGISGGLSVSTYSECTRYTVSKNDYDRSDWSLSLSTPTITSDSQINGLVGTNWKDLFSPGEVLSCSGGQVNPSGSRQYCSCEEFCTSDSQCFATFNCNWPATGSFSMTPPGDYVFEIPVVSLSKIDLQTGAKSPLASDIRYQISLTGGGTLKSGNQTPLAGLLTVPFTVPASSVGSRLSVTLNQSGGDLQEVGFGAPALYPLGWYEAFIEFGATRNTALEKGHVVSPPDDYPYTIGVIPPANNYCAKGGSVEQCYLALSPSPLDSDKFNATDFLLGPPSKSGAWFQVKDADLQTMGSLISNIPSLCKTPKCTASFDLSGPGGFPGIPAYTGTSAFGSGTVSDKGWIAKSGYSGRQYNYQYFKSQVSSGKFIKLGERFADKIGGDGVLTLTDNDLTGIAGSEAAAFAVYDGKVVVDRDTNFEGKKLVLFVGGDLSIKGRINLKSGDGFFATVVQGSINVDPSVVSQNPNQYGLEGIFLADGAVHTGTNNPVPGSGTPDGQLFIRGVLTGWQGVILERDLDPLKENGANNDKPAETIEYAPDLILNLPKELLRQGSVWREIAP